MKLMLCHLCGDLVVPDRNDCSIRACHCGNGAVAWTCGAKGELAMYAEGGRESVSMIGLSNALLRHKMTGSMVLKSEIENMISNTPRGYLFAPEHCGSLVIRTWPGKTSDVEFFAKLVDFYDHLTERSNEAKKELRIEVSDQPKEEP